MVYQFYFKGDIGSVTGKSCSISRRGRHVPRSDPAAVAAARAALTINHRSRYTYDTIKSDNDWQALWYNGFEEYQKLEPVLENNTISNVTVQLGSNAFLHCPVRHKADRGQISWVRKRDWHILSSGMLTFTNDERFQILHGESSDDWTLQIKYVQKRDNGTYECQVSTGAGLLSHYVNLNIVVPEAFILGSGEHHVDTDSVINLVCIIEKSPTPPQYVFWYHNERMINYDTARGGITVETEPGPKSQSRLTIRGARDTDSGNYTCSASNTEPASIYVFVTEGDKMAAISRRKSSRGSYSKNSLWCFFIIIITEAFALLTR
ncbi:transmembrane and immunoglobulin domain-containing protein 1-like [Arctopsyche grandis]|uniref:transmembrane and immunoglobulin domain-containing protein 1-like n=1 Tax=Arctopsyche grandis TaxID=121162 RepID=UPI00406DA4D1